MRIGEVGFGEVGFGEVGFGEVGIGEVGIGEVGFGEVGIGEVRIGEVGFGEVGYDEVGIGEVGFDEVGFGEVGIGEVGFGEPIDGVIINRRLILTPWCPINNRSDLEFCWISLSRHPSITLNYRHLCIHKWSRRNMSQIVVGIAYYSDYWAGFIILLSRLY